MDTPTPAICLLNVILDTTDTAAFATSVGSGVPGTYVARLDGIAQEFTLPELAVGPRQTALIISTATDSSLGFTRPVTVANGGSLSISGTAALSVAFMGLTPLTIADGGALSVSNVSFFSTCDPIRMLLGGGVSFGQDLSVAMDGNLIATLAETTPGTLTATMDGSTVATASLGAGGTVTTTGRFSSSMDPVAQWALAATSGAFSTCLVGDAATASGLAVASDGATGQCRDQGGSIDCHAAYYSGQRIAYSPTIPVTVGKLTVDCGSTTEHSTELHETIATGVTGLTKLCTLKDRFDLSGSTTEVLLRRLRFLSRRRDCHLTAPPCTFSRCFNRDKQGVSVK